MEEAFSILLIELPTLMVMQSTANQVCDQNVLLGKGSISCHVVDATSMTKQYTHIRIQQPTHQFTEQNAGMQGSLCVSLRFSESFQSSNDFEINNKSDVCGSK